MKKILTLFVSRSIKLMLLAIMLSGIVGCTERLSITDYTFEIQATVTSKGNNYINSNIPIEIRINNDVVQNSEVDVAMIGNSTSGSLSDATGKTIQQDDVFKHKFTQPLRLNFQPTVATENAILKFRVNGQEVSVKFSVSEATHNIKFEETPDTIKIGKAIDLKFLVSENSKAIAAAPTRAGGDSYTLSATMLQGKGILTIKDKVLINNHKAPSYLPEIVTKSADVEVTLPKETLVSATYTPYEQGKNTIQFKISDSFGNVVTQNKAMEVVRDSMKLKFTSTRGTAELGTTLLFDMLLDLDGYTGKFSVQPTLVTGAGNLQIDGQTCSLTTPFEISKTGIRKLTYVPTKSGKVKIAFDIKDEFGGMITDTLRGEVLENTFTVATELAPGTTIKYLENIPFVVTIKQEASNAEYTCIVKSNISGITLKKDNTVVELGKSTPISSGTHNYTLSGTACGDAVLTFEVKHATQDKKVNLNVPIKIEPYPFVVNLLNQSASITRLDIPITFDLQFATEKAPVDTRYEIKPTIKKGVGTLVPKNQLLLKNDVYKVDAAQGKEQFSYTPKSMGMHTVEFEVYDGIAFGQRKTVSLNVEVKAAELTVIPSLTEFDSQINENKAFSIQVSENDYKGNFQLYYDGGTGELRSSTGTLIERKALTPIVAGTTVLAYKPLNTGTELLTFVIKDDFNQTSAFTINVKSAHVPMTFTTTATASINLNCEGKISLDLGGATPFNIKYTGGTGTMKKSDDSNLASNTNTSVANSTQWKFTPTSIGTQTLTFTAEDKNGQTKTSTTTVNVAHVPMTFTTTKTVNVNVGSEASIALDLGGATPFNIKYTGGTGTMKNNTSNTISSNAVISISDNTTWKFTPTTFGTHTLTFTAEDKNGQTKTSTTTVNATHVPMTGSASFASGIIYTNREYDVNLAITGANPISIKYSGADGVLTQNGTVITPTSLVSLTGNTTFKYRTTSSTPHHLTFTAVDKNGQTKEFTASATAKPAITTLSINNTAQATVVNNAAAYNSVFVSSSVPYENKFELSGTVTGAGGRVAINSSGAGIITTVTGDIDFSFIPTTNQWGKSEITIRARNVIDNSIVSKTWSVINEMPPFEAYVEDNLSSTKQIGLSSQPDVEFELSAIKPHYAGNCTVTLSSDNPDATFSKTTITKRGEIPKTIITYSPSESDVPEPPLKFSTHYETITAIFNCDTGEQIIIKRVIKVYTWFSGAGDTVLPDRPPIRPIS